MFVAHYATTQESIGMSKKNKHKMSENFQSEKDEEKEVLNSEEQQAESAQDENTQQEEPQEETIEAKLAKSEAEAADLKDRLLRQMAEFDNYRKRTMKEKAEIILNGSAGVVTDILPVIDDLERAIANSAKSEDFGALKEGIELIYNKLMHILEQKGLQKISPKNEPFDTDFHEAIAMIPAPSEDLKGKVLDCAIDGYKLNDKVLRHAKVAVGE
jgi:molecular chaperone GrpE